MRHLVEENFFLGRHLLDDTSIEIFLAKLQICTEHNLQFVPPKSFLLLANEQQ
jgi:hypothetical protein